MEEIYHLGKTSAWCTIWIHPVRRILKSNKEGEINSCSYNSRMAHLVSHTRDLKWIRCNAFGTLTQSN